MRLQKRLIALFLAFSLLLSGCGNFSLPTNANTAFRNFTLCYFQDGVTANTINLHYSLYEPEKYGITEIPITFGSFDFNEASYLAAIENWEAALRKFPYKSLSAQNRLTYDILTYHLATLKKGASFYLYEEPLSPLTGIHAQLPVLLAEYQFFSTEDVDTYLSLLKTLPDYFSSLIRFERQKAAEGLFMSDAAVDSIVAQCNAFVSMGKDHYLLSTFETRLRGIKNLSSSNRNDYIKQNADVIATSVLSAYTTLAKSLSALKGNGRNSRGLCAFPSGKEYYSYLVAAESGSSRPVSELKTLVQNQIATDLNASQDILEQNPSILHETASSPVSPETMLISLKQKIGNAFPTSATVNVTIKHVPSALEEYLSPAFYLIPAIDRFSENTIYINGAYSQGYLDLFTTLAHEGYPGHLYQTTYFANTNPDPVRSLLDFTGYVEGWATYAEMCSYYISPLEKTYATLLQKNNSLVLGLYAAADIGIHYDGWTLDDTIAFFSDYGISDAETIRQIYEYIVGDPANYVTYYVGYLEMMELKKEMIQKKGDAFSQKEFHQRVLEIGPAPFDIVQKYLYK